MLVRDWKWREERTNTTNTCGDLDLWWKTPQKTPHVLLSVWWQTVMMCRYLAWPSWRQTIMMCHHLAWPSWRQTVITCHQFADPWSGWQGCAFLIFRIVYVASMNLLYSLSMYSHFQSNNKCEWHETKWYGIVWEHECISVSSSTAWYILVANRESIITSRGNLLHYAEVAQGCYSSSIQGKHHIHVSM